MASNELTIEAWLKPANLTQNGPARIVTLSPDLLTRNFTLGQGISGADSDAYEVRLRSSLTSSNGTPALATPAGALKTQLTHVVFTRDQAGVTKIFTNGVERATGDAGGDLSNWDGAFRLGLANELTGDRPWLGELHLVAVFDRALPEVDILQNFAAGPSPTGEIHATVFSVQVLDGPVSLFATPNAMGDALSAAQSWDGVPGSSPVPVDATIGVQLVDGFGDPVVGFPAANITVMAQHGGWATCPDFPLIADGPTDATGTTTISGVLVAGGSSAPGELLQVGIADPAWNSTNYPAGLAGLEYFINSADLNGDLGVDLSDVADFAETFKSGVFDFALDFHRDGVINLSDVTRLGVGLGAMCDTLAGSVVVLEQPDDGASEEEVVAVEKSALRARLTMGIAPNPFNPMTEIRFSLPNGGPVKLSIFDTRGQLMATLLNGDLGAGEHRVVWKGTDGSGRTVASGVYFSMLQTGEGNLLEKMVLVR